MNATATIGIYIVVKVEHAKNRKRIEAKVKQAIEETISRMAEGIEVGAILDGDSRTNANMNDLRDHLDGEGTQGFLPLE